MERGEKNKDIDEPHVSGQANKPLSLPAHALPVDQFISEIKTNPQDGLTSEEAQARLQEYGVNELDNGPGVQPLKILIRQIANAMILVLVMAMIVSFAIGSYIEGGVVCAVIVLNIVVGFLQEFHAEKTLDSLRTLSSPTASVVRDGITETIPTIHLVPGDLVELATGDVIPADIRLFEVMNFETDEALLTGESLPVQKSHSSIFEPDTGPGDRLNVAFSSSTVTRGRARGIVFATRMKTEIGAIATALRESESRRRPVKRNEKGKARPHRYIEAWGLTLGDFIGAFLGVNVGTPLQRKLSKLAILLFGCAVICAIIVLGANSFSNQREVIIYAVATGLSMIPASLIVVLTITMAAGTKQMATRNVVVRKLDSLEALGAVTNICSDKTGTLTQGKMVVRKAWIPSRGTYSVEESDEAFNPTIGDLTYDTSSPAQIESSTDANPEDNSERDLTPTPFQDLLDDNEELEQFLRIATLANLAQVYKSDNSWKARGDPTEIAIQVFASRFDRNRTKLTNGDAPQWSQIAEYPFDSEIKKMSVIFRENSSNQQVVFTKGAVERVISSCTDYIPAKGLSPVKPNRDAEQGILENMEALAAQGLRVLALASKSWVFEDNIDDVKRSTVERDLTFQGLLGLYDPPRHESKDAVKRCQEAGVLVHMLTGDHPGTAVAIAKQVGILPHNMHTFASDVTSKMTMTAHDFDKLSEAEIDALPVLPLVIARCSPATKVKMIEALHRRERFAAMTGDGVNDSPSLKYADVGIAMGQAGSDVAKDASDIVLADDNFASILNAVEEGRRMFDNIQKFILHLLAENIAQACTLLIGLAFKDDTGLSVFPLAPVEILWIIMITSGLPDMGLGFEIAAPDIMARPPHSLKTGVFTLEVIVDMLVYGLWMATLCLLSFSLVMFVWGNGNLGEGCNNNYSDVCNTVFRARATTFVCMTWFALFLAWEMVNMRRSFFRMQPKSKKYFTQWIHDIWRNRFLFWSIMAGFLTIFPILYIPVLNHVVFKHTGISWEWGIVFVEAVLFVAGVELWKWCKRIFFRRMERRNIKKGTKVDIFNRYRLTGDEEVV
ncbi:potassium/sodium efflux P-type ATPase [Xylogone sp. PMI_703]|nr:potassium/sodium efflux P-type ATPase [Xylogone sp. PMI_703]